MLFTWDKVSPEETLKWRYFGIAKDINNNLVYFMTNSLTQFYNFKKTKVFFEFKFISGKKNKIYDAIKIIEE